MTNWAVAQQTTPPQAATPQAGTMTWVLWVCAIIGALAFVAVITALVIRMISQKPKEPVTGGGEESTRAPARR